MPPISIPGVIFTLIVVLSIAVHFSSTRRFRFYRERKALRQEWAEANGYEMADPVDPKATVWRPQRFGIGPSLAKQYVEFGSFRPGKGRAFNFIQGQRGGFRFTIFDYAVKHNESRPIYYSVAVLEAPMLIPRFILKPRKAWHTDLRLTMRKERQIDFPGLDSTLALSVPDNEIASEKLSYDFFMKVLQTGARSWISTGRRLTAVRNGLLAVDEYETFLDSVIETANYLMSREEIEAAAKA